MIQGKSSPKVRGLMRGLLKCRQQCICWRGVHSRAEYLYILALIFWENFEKNIYVSVVQEKGRISQVNYADFLFLGFRFRKRENKRLIFKSSFQCNHHSKHPAPQSREGQQGVVVVSTFAAPSRAAIQPARSTPSPVQWLVVRPLVNPARGGVAKKFSRKKPRQETTRDTRYCCVRNVRL